MPRLQVSMEALGHSLETPASSLSRGARARVEHLLESCGVRIDGPEPWDLSVHDDRLYPRLLTHGSMGLGESYVEGAWDAFSLDGFLYRLLQARVDERVHGFEDYWEAFKAHVLNLQNGARAFQIGERHYDIGNELYAAMLGDPMVYSCGYWRSATTLSGAQCAKLDLVCRKLGLEPGMCVLDIGCGWGEALRYACQHYGVRGIGVTVSKEQADFSRALCYGMPIQIRLQDYRELFSDPIRFDRILSIGMIEHVGAKNHRTYFELARRCLTDDGLFLLHTIGAERSGNHADPWIGKYIFPNSLIPSAAQLTQAVEGLFVVEDWHNFGADYDPTLMAWRSNFEQAWPAFAKDYDESFYRMWRYYLSLSAACFRARRTHLWQIVLSPRGVAGGYVAPR